MEKERNNSSNQNEIFRSPGQHVVSSIGMFWLLVLFLFGDESKQSKSTSWMMSANRVAIPFSSICPLLVETRACLWVPPIVVHWIATGMDMGQTLAVLQNRRTLGKSTGTPLPAMEWKLPYSLVLFGSGLQEGFHNVLKTTRCCKMQRRGGILARLMRSCLYVE